MQMDKIIDVKTQEELLKQANEFFCDENNLAKPMATIPGMFRNTITLLGLSKSYGMASLRAGFLIADEIIIRETINRIFQGWTRPLT